jgi:nucleoside-diphosphate-sugar epimerase
MKIMITGGMGFIGSYLSEQLFAEKHDLIILTKSFVKKHNITKISKKIIRANSLSEAVLTQSASSLHCCHKADIA